MAVMRKLVRPTDAEPSRSNRNCRMAVCFRSSKGTTVSPVSCTATNKQSNKNDKDSWIADKICVQGQGLQRDQVQVRRQVGLGSQSEFRCECGYDDTVTADAISS